MEDRRKLIPFLLLVPLLIFSITPVFAAGPAPQTNQTVVEIAAEDGRFDTLVTALEAADLMDTLNGEGPFTVFAPTDDAFDALPEGTLDELLADPESLESVLLYHVVADKVTATDVATLESAETVAGEPVDISLDENVVLLNDAAQVIIADIDGSNGVIHAIDTVLLPASAGEMAVEPLDAPAEESEALEEETLANEPAETELDSEEDVNNTPGALPVTGVTALTTNSNNTLFALSILGLMVAAGGMALYTGKSKR